jgi:hypothetical protein
MKALGQYTREVDEDDRRTAAILGIKRSTLAGWLRGGDPPQKRILARAAGFLRRVGYLSARPAIAELCKLGDEVEGAANQGNYGTWKQKREQLKEALAARKREEAEFVRRLQDPERRQRDLDDTGISLLAIASDLVSDAVDKSKPAVARKLEHAISQLSDALDTLEDAQQQLVK